MGREWCRLTRCRHTFSEADEVLGFALSRLFSDGPEAELTDTMNVQPALLTISVAILRAIASETGVHRDGRQRRDLLCGRP